MGANHNTFDPSIVVPDIAALSLVHAAELDEATIAYVESEQRLYLLRKGAGGVPNLYSRVTPAAGSPIAGVPDARWLRLDSGMTDSNGLFSLLVDTVVVAGPAVDLVTIQFVVSNDGVQAMLTASVGFRLGGGSGAGDFTLDVDGNLVHGTAVNIQGDQGLAIIGRFPADLIPVFLPAGAHVATLKALTTGAATITILAASVPAAHHASLRIEQLLF